MKFFYSATLVLLSNSSGPSCHLGGFDRQDPRGAVTFRINRTPLQTGSSHFTLPECFFPENPQSGPRVKPSPEDVGNRSPLMVTQDVRFSVLVLNEEVRSLVLSLLRKNEQFNVGIAELNG